MFNAKLKTVVKSWELGMKDFHFTPDGITLVPRAGFKIADNTPYEYRLILAKCIDDGYITPIAYQPIEEVFLEELTK